MYKVFVYIAAALAAFFASLTMVYAVGTAYRYLSDIRQQRQKRQRLRRLSQKENNKTKK
jgi:heme exporter protein D